MIQSNSMKKSFTAIALCLTNTFAFANSEETLPSTPMADLVWKVRPNLAFNESDIRYKGIVKTHSDCDGNGNFVKNPSDFTRLKLRLIVDNDRIVSIYLLSPQDAELHPELIHRFQRARLHPNLNATTKYQTHITLDIDPNGVELMPTAKCRIKRILGGGAKK